MMLNSQEPIAKLIDCPGEFGPAISGGDKCRLIPISELAENLEKFEPCLAEHLRNNCCDEKGGGQLVLRLFFYLFGFP